MTSYRRFEQLLKERVKTLDDIRAAIERIRDLVGVIAEQSKLEQQWANSYPQARPDIQTDETLGNGV